MVPRRRFGLLPILTVAAILAASALAEPAGAHAATDVLSERVGNGSFEQGLRGWRGHRARVGLVRRGRGHAVRVEPSRTRRRPSGFSIYRSPMFRTAAVGTLYEASGWVRALRAGQRICLRIREGTARRAIGRAGRCLPTTGRWQRLPRVRYRARRAGSALGLAVSKSRGAAADVFWADGIELARVDPSAGRPAGESAARNLPSVGTQFHCVWRSYTNPQRIAVLDALRAAGAQWVRIDVGWYGIEDSAKGARSTGYVELVDFCVDEARKRGLQVLVLLWLTPAWANGGRGERAPPANPQDYADFARWAAAYWRGRVSAWEVWNEPNLDDFWKGTPEEYAALLRASYPAFKAGDPSAQVVSAGVSYNDDGWLARMYAAGAGGSFDVLATHPYMGPSDLPPEVTAPDDIWKLAHVAAVRSLMERHGDGAKPIWFTELGWSSHANTAGLHPAERGVTHEQQADYLVRSLRFTGAQFPYVQRVFWYNERDHAESARQYDNYGLLFRDGSPKPAYWALKKLLTDA